MDGPRSQELARPPDVEQGSGSRWWSAEVSEILVDVGGLAPEARRQLGIQSCCAGACGVLTRCGFCCLLTVIVPIFLLAAGGQLPIAQDIRSLAPAAAAVLLAAGVLLCCCSIRKTCGQGVINVPEPAPLVPPLSKKDGRRIATIRRVLLIYNPNAGKRRAETVLREAVVPGLQKRGVECEIMATQHAGHARELAATCDLARFDAVVALGGDGSFHEVVNGMIARQDGQRVPVSFVPVGSGNGLSATLRQNMRRRGGEVATYTEMNAVIRWSLDRIASGKVVPVDLLEVEVKDRRLVAVMQVYLGLLAEVDILAEPFRWMGPVRLDLVPVWSILKRQGKEFSCRVVHADGSSEELRHSAIGANVGLNQHFSDTMRSVPAAQLDDGIAEFNVISAEASVDELLASFMKLSLGAHTQDTKVWNSRPVKEVNFDFGGPGVFNVDGEILQHDGKLRICVLPRSLDMLVGIEEWETAAPAAEASTPVAWRAYTRRWAMLAIYGINCMLNQAIWIGFAPAQAEVMSKYDVSEDWVNWLSLVFMVLYLPMAGPAAYVMDVHGCRNALLLGTSLQLVGAGLRCVLPIGPCTPAVLLMSGQVLCAISQPFFTGMPPKIAAVWFPAYQRALGDTLAALTSVLGSACGFLMPATLGLQHMLYVQFGWAVVGALLTWVFFRRSPPTPASPISERAHSANNFTHELADAFRNGQLMCLVVAFACALGSFNCLGTLAAELTRPFGFSDNDASGFGTFTVLSGFVGATVMTTVVSVTGRYRMALLISLSISAASVILATVVQWRMDPSPLRLALVDLAFATLGFGTTPVIPLVFEAASEVAYPTGEGTVASLCIASGQVSGIALTLVLNALLKRGWALWAWVLSAGLFFIGLGSVACFHGKGRRSACEGAGEGVVPDPQASCPLLG